MRIRASFKNELTGLEAELDVEDDIPAGPVEDYFLRACDLARVFSGTLAEQVASIVNQDAAEGRHQQLLDLVNSTERRCSARVGVVEAKLSTSTDFQSQLREDVKTLRSSVEASIEAIATHRGATNAWSTEATQQIQKLMTHQTTALAGHTNRIDELSQRVALLEQPRPTLSETPCRKTANRKARKPVRAHRST